MKTQYIRHKYYHGKKMKREKLLSTKDFYKKQTMDSLGVEVDLQHISVEGAFDFAKSYAEYYLEYRKNEGGYYYDNIRNIIFTAKQMGFHLDYQTETWLRFELPESLDEQHLRWIWYLDEDFNTNLYSGIQILKRAVKKEIIQNLMKY